MKLLALLAFTMVLDASIVPLDKRTAVQCPEASKAWCATPSFQKLLHEYWGQEAPALLAKEDQSLKQGFNYPEGTAVAPLPESVKKVIAAKYPPFFTSQVLHKPEDKSFRFGKYTTIGVLGNTHSGLIYLAWDGNVQNPTFKAIRTYQQDTERAFLKGVKYLNRLHGSPHAPQIESYAVVGTQAPFQTVLVQDVHNMGSLTNMHYVKTCRDQDIYAYLLLKWLPGLQSYESKDIGVRSIQSFHTYLYADWPLKDEPNVSVKLGDLGFSDSLDYEVKQAYPTPTIESFRASRIDSAVVATGVDMRKIMKPIPQRLWTFEEAIKRLTAYVNGVTFRPNGMTEAQRKQEILDKVKKCLVARANGEMEDTKNGVAL